MLCSSSSSLCKVLFHATMGRLFLMAFFYVFWSYASLFSKWSACKLPWTTWLHASGGLPFPVAPLISSLLLFPIQFSFSILSTWSNHLAHICGTHQNDLKTGFFWAWNAWRIGEGDGVFFFKCWYEIKTGMGRGVINFLRRGYSDNIITIWINSLHVNHFYYFSFCPIMTVSLVMRLGPTAWQGTYTLYSSTYTWLYQSLCYCVTGMLCKSSYLLHSNIWIFHHDFWP